MRQKRDTSNIQYAAQQFSKASFAIRDQERQTEQKAVAVLTKWKGKAADEFREHYKLLGEDLERLGQAFEKIASNLITLAVQFNTINSYIQQVEQLQHRIDRLEEQLWKGSPDRRESLHQELTHLRRQRAQLEHQADELERRAQHDGDRRFDEVAAMVKDLHFADYRPKGAFPGFSASDFIVPGIALGLMGTGSVVIQSVDGSKYTIKMGNWLHGQSRFAWWNTRVADINGALSSLRVGGNSVVDVVQDKILGVDPKLTEFTKWKLPLHMAAKVAAPIEIVTSVGAEMPSITESWTKNEQTAKSREEFWKNFTADAAASLNKVVWTTGGAFGGTAVVAAFGTALTGPGGGILGGLLGAEMGKKFGEWMGEKTEDFAREVGVSAGVVIADTLNAVDDIKVAIQEFDQIVEEAFSGIF